MDGRETPSQGDLGEARTDRGGLRVSDAGRRAQGHRGRLHGFPFEALLPRGASRDAHAVFARRLSRARSDSLATSESVSLEPVASHGGGSRRDELLNKRATNERFT